MVVHKVGTLEQVADALTKALAKPAFIRHRNTMLGDVGWIPTGAGADAIDQEAVDEIARHIKGAARAETLSTLDDISPKLTQAVVRAQEATRTDPAHPPRG